MNYTKYNHITNMNIKGDLIIALNTHYIVLINKGLDNCTEYTLQLTSMDLTAVLNTAEQGI